MRRPRKRAIKTPMAAAKTAMKMSWMMTAWPMSAHTRGLVRCHTSLRDALRPRMVRETVTMSRPVRIEEANIVKMLLTPDWA